MNQVFENKTRSRRLLTGVLSPVERFLKLESASGILLILTTIVALVWANSPWKESYVHLVHLPLGFSIGGSHFHMTLHEWINDGLMALFFFVVGLEIKRELIFGELSTPRKAALPLFAALGGMVFPALIYTFFNINGGEPHGWGIPMATDIAFAVGVVTLLNHRVPFSLKIFLLALAIVDDLGAVLVIAFFYTDSINTQALGFAGLAVAFNYFFRHAGVRRKVVYISIGIVMWLATLKSGVHATIAGVVLGFLTPIRPLIKSKDLPERFTKLMGNISKEIDAEAEDVPLNSHTVNQLEMLHDHVLEVQSPLERAIQGFHPWVTYIIMPLFALVNAGVSLSGVDFNSIASHPVTLGVIFGLVLGKPLGVMVFSWLAIRMNLGELPKGVGWYQLLSMGFLAGIGFTMALFVSHLALPGNEEAEMYSKLGILVASFSAAFIGASMILIRKAPKVKEGP